jgi:hypothetical protein
MAIFLKDLRHVHLKNKKPQLLSGRFLLIFAIIAEKPMCSRRLIEAEAKKGIEIEVLRFAAQVKR